MEAVGGWSPKGRSLKRATWRAESCDAIMNTTTIHRLLLKMCRSITAATATATATIDFIFAGQLCSDHHTPSSDELERRTIDGAVNLPELQLGYALDRMMDARKTARSGESTSWFGPSLL
jgi:hypothetical protein